MAKKNSYPYNDNTVVKCEESRLGLIDDCDGDILLWVGRHDDTEDDDRVIRLTQAKLKKLIKRLQREVL